MLLIAGGIALAGYPIGAASSERFGRVPTVSGFAILLALSTMWSFWGPPSNFRELVLWLGMGVAAFGLATNATNVGANSSATELLPSGLRTTMIGCTVLAGAMGSGKSIIASLAPRLGGVSNVIGYLGLLAIGVSILFGFLIDESRGMTLEEIETPLSARSPRVAKRRHELSRGHRRDLLEPFELKTHRRMQDSFEIPAYVGFVLGT